MTGYRTYVTLVVGFLFDLIAPRLGIPDLDKASVIAAVNTFIIIIAGIFHYLHKSKEKNVPT